MQGVKDNAIKRYIIQPSPSHPTSYFLPSKNGNPFGSGGKAIFGIKFVGGSNCRFESWDNHGSRSSAADWKVELLLSTYQENMETLKKYLCSKARQFFLIITILWMRRGTFKKIKVTRSYDLPFKLHTLQIITIFSLYVFANKNNHYQFWESVSRVNLKLFSDNLFWRDWKDDFFPLVLATDKMFQCVNVILVWVLLWIKKPIPSIQWNWQPKFIPRSTNFFWKTCCNLLSLNENNRYKMLLLLQYFKYWKFTKCIRLLAQSEYTYVSINTGNFFGFFSANFNLSSVQTGEWLHRWWAM